MAEPKETVRRFYEAIQAQQIDAAMALCDPDIAVRNPVGEFRGAAPFRAYWMGDIDAFPDRRYDVVHLMEDGGTVVAEVTMTGTHTGALRVPGRVIPPTGRHAQLAVTAVFDVEAGKIVATRAQFDRLGFLEQLGLWPPTPARL
ncbi:MAG: hypothetical protein NVS9B6_19680 [Candidatus Limnocylindrales bacterium]